MAKEWENKIVAFANQGQPINFSLVAAQLDKITVDGWELAASHMISEGIVYYLKRPKALIQLATEIPAA